MTIFWVLIDENVKVLYFWVIFGDFSRVEKPHRTHKICNNVVKSMFYKPGIGFI